MRKSYGRSPINKTKLFSRTYRTPRVDLLLHVADPVNGAVLVRVVPGEVLPHPAVAHLPGLRGRPAAIPAHVHPGDGAVGDRGVICRVVLLAGHVWNLSHWTTFNVKY